MIDNRRISNSVSAMLVLALMIVAQSCKTPQPPPPLLSYTAPRSKAVPRDITFEVNKAVLTERDTLILSWNVDASDTVPVTATLNGDTVSRKGISKELPGYGRKEFKLVVSTADTVITRSVSVMVERIATVSWTPDDVSNGPDDGRFTIGCRGQRLTYGYPAPLSTSHIIVKVNGAYATNNPSLAGRDNVSLLKGHSIRAGRIGFNRTEIPFRFYGVDVLQRVVPVDRSFNEITNEQDAVYYRMSWTLTSRHSETVNVGLAYLLDTMIDDNDAARVEADATVVSRETEFSGNSVPSSFLVYRRDTDATDLTAVYLTFATATRKPTSIVVGRWPFLHSQIWKASVPGSEYYDSAIMSVWDDLKLKPGESITVTSFYGTKQGYPLVMIDNNMNLRSQILTFNYDKSETSLSSKDIARIKDMVQGRRIIAASVSGFSDAQGDDTENLEVSRQRAERIQQQLARYGVDKRLIMLKAYGESQALQTIEAQQTGVPADRRVEINIWHD